MGLFGRKVPENEIKAIYYEGLKGFVQNGACFISVEDDRLLIKSIKPEIEVTLRYSQIQNVEIMRETDFMARYQGHAQTTAKTGVKMYVVVKYTSSEGSDNKLVFWYAGSEVKTGDRFRALASNLQSATPSSYSL